MNTALDLDGPRFGPAQAADGKPKELIVLLHGWLPHGVCVTSG